MLNKLPRVARARVVSLVAPFCALCFQVLAEFCAQDEDGQTPLLFAARSGSGAVFRQALEALMARATPEKVSMGIP